MAACERAYTDKFLRELTAGLRHRAIGARRHRIGYARIFE